MKVLQINQTYRNGGSTGRIAYDLLLSQKQNGIDGFVVYGYSDGEEFDAYSLCLQTNTLRRKANILRTRLFDAHGFYNEHETKVLIKKIDAFKPDIIHLHNIHNHYVNVGMLFDFIKKNDIPVVWTLHDCWSFTGHCAYFDYANCDKWKTLCHDCSSIHEYPPTWFFDRSSRNYKDKKEAFSGVNNLTLVTPSKWLADLTRQSFLKDYSVQVVNNGVDTQLFNPQVKNVKHHLGIEGKKMLLAMATTFDRRKGTQYLKQLPSMLGDDEVLVLVGLAKDQLGQFNMPRCIGIGRTNSVKELAEYYASADVFINPTLEDNFPTTNIEALACGTPVVTFNTGGSVESVLDGDSNVGAVVPKGDLQSLLMASRKIMAGGKGAYSKACRKKAETLYDKNKQYMKYIELYNEVYTKQNIR